MNAPQVFRFDTGTEQDLYRKAVSQIIRDIQKAHQNRDLCLIADDIGISKETIHNAVNKRSDLNALYLARLGRRFGKAFLKPYHDLCEPQDGDPPLKDILPIASLVAHKIACARDPDGPGGATEVPQERAGYLPALKQLHREVGCLIPQLEASL